jgi:multidrug efflux pump subunit AcrB
MPSFALRYPFFIIMLCLMVALVGIVNLFSMPVDLFPDIDVPVSVVVTVFLVPAVYLAIHTWRERRLSVLQGAEA